MAVLVKNAAANVQLVATPLSGSAWTTPNNANGAANGTFATTSVGVLSASAHHTWYTFGLLAADGGPIPNDPSVVINSVIVKANIKAGTAGTVLTLSGDSNSSGGQTTGVAGTFGTSGALAVGTSLAYAQFTLTTTPTRAQLADGNIGIGVTIGNPGGLSSITYSLDNVEIDVDWSINKGGVSVNTVTTASAKSALVSKAKAIGPVASAGGAGSTIAFVRKVAANNGAGSTTSIGIVPGVNTTAGNTLVLLMGQNQSPASTLVSVTDTKGNTWVIQKTQTVGNDSLSISTAYLTNALTTSDTITVTWSSAPTYYVFDAEEYSGIAQTLALDLTSSGSGTGTAMSAGTLGTLANTGELIVAAFGAEVPGVGFTLTAGSGYTAVDNEAPAVGLASITEYRLATATTGNNPTATANASAIWVACAISLKAVPAGVATNGAQATGAKTELVNKSSLSIAAPLESGSKTQLVNKAGTKNAEAVTDAASKTVLQSRVVLDMAAGTQLGNKTELLNKAATSIASVSQVGAKTTLLSKLVLQIATASNRGAKTILINKSGLNLEFPLKWPGAKTVLVNKSVLLTRSGSIKGFERVYTFSIAGTTRSNDNSILVSCRVDLFTTGPPPVYKLTVTSDPSTGAYVFSPLPGDSTQYFIRSWKAGAPFNVFGTSDENLTVSSNQIQGPP